ncbi:hypothetical protein J6590_080826 [Homalodisca vitripennis]|nr:hypothetical protein J6590_080826 [Homalodisca vitripennis]
MFEPCSESASPRLPVPDIHLLLGCRGGNSDKESRGGDAVPVVGSTGVGVRSKESTEGMISMTPDLTGEFPVSASATLVVGCSHSN